jgi:hypothetical protein
LVCTLHHGNLDFSILDPNLGMLQIVSTKFVSLAIFLEILNLACKDCKELWLLRMFVVSTQILLGFAF